MATHKALGRGLNALFSTQGAVKDKENKTEPKASVPKGAEVLDLDVEKIRPNRHQPRTHFDDDSLEELSQSIKLHGVAQPLIVTKTDESDQFELVVGERRLRAAKLAGLKSVPCILRTYSNQKRFEVALIENLQRQDLNALEEAIAIDGLMKEYGLKQEEVASALGKSRSAVANTLRFLRLHEDVQVALRDGSISEGHAKILAGLTEHSEQLRFLGKIKEHKLTVRDLEHEIAGKPTAKGKAGGKGPASQRYPEIKKYEEDIQRLLGRRVEIQTGNGKKGWIRFAFYSPWDLEMLLKKLDLHEGKSTEE